MPKYVRSIFGTDIRVKIGLEEFFSTSGMSSNAEMSNYSRKLCLGA